MFWVRHGYECVCACPCVKERQRETEREKVGGEAVTKNSGVGLQGAGKSTGSPKRLIRSQGHTSCPDIFLRSCFREAKFSIGKIPGSGVQEFRASSGMEWPQAPEQGIQPRTLFRPGVRPGPKSGWRTPSSARATLS